MKNLIRIVCLCALVLGSGRLWAQVPLLNSYPSATAVIFLDFDGHRVEGTSWNYMGPIDCAPSGLSETKIMEVFNRIAEDFRPFNLNLTTDSTKFIAAPVTQRMRVIMTTSSSWYGVAGGVAFTGSFSWPDDNPCFVFTALHGYRTKDIAEAGVHEAGHTLGLYHQSKYDAGCYKISEYNSGAGSGEIGWAPIMGVGYSRNFTLWHNGPNTYGCMSVQNDLEIISSPANGFGFREDDHGTSFAAATVPVFSNNEFEMTGIIGQNSDQDYFRFIMPSTGRFELDAIPYNVGTGNAGSNLDLQVTLYDNNEVSLSTYNPGNLLNSVADTTLAAGTYYLKVEGKGNLYAPEYASLGSYSLLGRIDTDGGDVLPLRQLTLSGLWNNGNHQLQWIIDADETISSQILEVSEDGRKFEVLEEVNAASRQFLYRPAYSGVTLYYRLRAELSDGRRYYSNTAVIREMVAKNRAKIVSNPASAQNLQIDVPEPCQYQMFDLNGRVVARGQLQVGIQTLPALRIKAGMYMIQFSSNGQHFSEKVIIQ